MPAAATRPGPCGPGSTGRRSVATRGICRGSIATTNIARDLILHSWQPIEQGAPGMDDDTVIRLRRVVLKLARQLNAASREEGLTPTQASVLGIATTRGPLSLAELTELEGINPTMLSRVIGKLDSFGLIRRLRDPDDFRAAWVEVTPEGKRRYERISAQRSAIISDCVAGLPADQEAALAAALPAFENLADKLRSTVRDGRNQLIRGT